jgi:acyl transferase domain-containing protein
MGRRSFKHRRLITGGTACRGRSPPSTQKDPAFISTRELHEAAPGVVFMFPGQGSQYVNMGRDLHASEPVFAQHFDQCCALFNKALNTDLKAILFPAKGSEEEAAAETLKQTVNTQAALFTVQYSLAKLWMHWGIVPEAMMGHSIGEFAAACLGRCVHAGRRGEAGKPARQHDAGTARRKHAERARCGRRRVADTCLKGCSIAANNGPKLCVASGPKEAIEKLLAALQEKGIEGKLLATSHAFHSPMMDAMVVPYERVVDDIRLNAPRIPSSVPYRLRGSRTTKPPAANTGAVTCVPRCALHKP